MSLDIHLFKNKYPTENSLEAFDEFYNNLENKDLADPLDGHLLNITHNLNHMAGKIKVSDDLTLYDILWRPEEHGLEKAKDVINLLEIGIKELAFNLKHYQQYNSPNGWGKAENLLTFACLCLSEFKEHPDAYIFASR